MIRKRKSKRKRSKETKEDIDIHTLEEIIQFT